MSVIREIVKKDPEFPHGLYDLGVECPESFTVEGNFSPASPRVAIVGARDGTDEMRALAKRLATVVASAGGIVISGGAFGIDTAAHEGALEGRGRTWSVIGCGGAHITPKKNAALFASILAHDGAIVRTRDDDRVTRNLHLDRNRVLVALSEIVIVLQAKKKSGTMSSAGWGLTLKRPMWVVPSPLNANELQFEGTWILLEGRHANVRALWSEEKFFRELFGRALSRARKAPKGLTDDERKVFDVLGNTAKHPDEIALETGLPTPAVTTALLTLALGDVVVEGSAGLFQRR